MYMSSVTIGRQQHTAVSIYLLAFCVFFIKLESFLVSILLLL